MSFQSVLASLNAAAVGVMQQGENKRAAAMHTSLLKEIRHLCEQSYSSFYYKKNGMATLPIQAVSLQPAKPSRDDMNCDSGDSDFTLQQSSILLYNRAFLLPTCGSQSIESTSVVLCYNAGLALHRAGIASCCSSTCKEALAYYREAFDMIHFVEDHDEFAGIMTVVAALLQNMSQIYAEWFQVDNARHLRRKLELIFEGRGGLFMSEDDYTWFSLSIFHTTSEDFRVAPAA